MTQPVESVVDRDDLLKALTTAFPPLSPVDRELGRLLYAELRKGRPVYRERLASLTRQSTRDVVAALESEQLAPLLLYDRMRRIVGFAGLSLEETPFAIVAGGQALYTWCAWDALFIPEMISRTVELRSRCPQTGQDIHLTVHPDHIESVDPPKTVLSFVAPNASVCHCGAEASRREFCDHVSFFASAEAAGQWTAGTPGTFVLGLQEAFQLARAFNATRFGEPESNADTSAPSP